MTYSYKNILYIKKQNDKPQKRKNMERQKLKTICSQICKIIDETNNGNVCDNIVAFYDLTSQLYDCRDEIEAIPIAQKHPNFFVRLFNRKSAEEMYDTIKKQEEEKCDLFKAITNAGRYEQGYNRTKKGEKVTKDSIFFCARILGSEYISIASIEAYKYAKPTIYNAIVGPITDYVKNFKANFAKTNWL